MAFKGIKLTSGQLAEQEFNTSSAGAGDAGKPVALDGAGRIDQSMMPVGVGADAKTLEASENIAAGDFVNIHDSTGQKVRKADASNGRRAHGFALASITSGQSGLIYFEGNNTGLTSLTPGTTYYLGTSGAATATPPSTSGHIVHELGAAVTATELSFEPQRPVTLA